MSRHYARLAHQHRKLSQSRGNNTSNICVLFYTHTHTRINIICINITDEYIIFYKYSDGGTKMYMVFTPHDCEIRELPERSVA